MFKIVRIPSKLEFFFRSLKTGFRWEHFDYFKTFVLLFAFSWGRRNVSNLYRHVDAETHRTRFNNFFLVGRFDLEKTLRQKAYELIKRLKPSKGDTIYFIIDDSKKLKRGKRMAAVSKVRDHVSGKYMPGHQYVTAIIKIGEHVIPFGVSLYAKKELCPKLNLKFRKTTQMAADLIRAFNPPSGLKTVVLFDSFYLCPKVVNACHDKGFNFVSVLKDNRNLFRNSRKHKTGKYKKNTFYRKPKKTLSRVNNNGKIVSYNYVNAGVMEVGKLGPMRVVLSRKNKKKKILVIVTNDLKLDPEEMILFYAERWAVEVFFKDTKQLLGLGQYQNQPYQATVIHLHLVCFAYALLTHLKINLGAKGKRKKKSAVKMSTADLQNELRRLVWKDLVQYLEEKPNGNSVVKELQRLLVA